MILITEVRVVVRKRLFLDDERYPTHKSNWIIVRTVEDAKREVLQNGPFEFISFDHDLGEDLTGYDFVKWLCEYDHDNNFKIIPKNFEYRVHSMNPIGKKNIENYLQSYMKFRDNSS